MGLYKYNRLSIVIEYSMDDVWGRVPHLFQEPVKRNVLDQVVSDNAHGNLLV